MILAAEAEVEPRSGDPAFNRWRHHPYTTNVEYGLEAKTREIQRSEAGVVSVGISFDLGGGSVVFPLIPTSGQP